MTTHVKSALISLAGIALTFGTQYLVPSLTEAYPWAAPIITGGFAWLSNFAYKKGWLGGLLKPKDETKTDTNPEPDSKIEQLIDLFKRGMITDLPTEEDKQPGPLSIRDAVRNRLADLAVEALKSSEKDDQEAGEQILAFIKEIRE